MNQPATVAWKITLGEFKAMVEGWNIANSQGDEDSLEPPTAEWWEAQQKRINETPHLTVQ